MAAISNEHLNRSIDLWVAITGIDPDSFGIGDVHSINKELREAQELDPTGITVRLMLRYYVEEYLSTRTFTPNEMLENPDKIKDYLNKCVELKEILSSSDLAEATDKFIGGIRDALEEYGGLKDEVENMLDSEEIGFIRRDALRAMNELKTYQFLQGEPDRNEPKYNEWVSEFWNTNSLVDVMMNQAVSGISLVMIKTEDAEFSYFGFAIRNGATVTLLTDRPTYPHPDSQYMRRSRGRAREFENRAFRLRFPYSLFDMNYDEKGNSHPKERGSTALVPRQKNAHQIKKVVDLEPDELIWTVMMFDLIVEKFWVNNHHTAELAYTGEMVNDSRILIDSAAAKNLPVKAYVPFEVLLLTSEDVSSENMCDEWERKPIGNNAWMEERYADSVKEDLLNIVHDGERGTLQLTTKNELEIIDQDYDKNSLFSDSRRRKSGHFGSLRCLDPAAFGTAEELEFRRKWAARFNKAQMLSQAAKKEFEDTEDEVCDWYEKHVKANEAVLRGAASGEFMTLKQHNEGFDFVVDPEPKNICKVYFMPHHDRGYDKWAFRRVVISKGLNTRGYHRCFITGTKAEIAAVFHPMCPQALADLAGVEVEDLPEVLQHWYTEKRYAGNSILKNIDPLEWVAKNPWMDLNFGVAVFLSKRGCNGLRKSFGLGPNKFWLTEKPEDD